MYKIAIHRQEFADLYLLDAVYPFLDNSSNLAKYRKRLIFSIATEYLKELIRAIKTEMRHKSDKATINFELNPKAEDLLRSFGIDPFNVDKGDVSELSLEACKVLFRTLRWDPWFGGEPWEKITEATLQLKKAIESKDENAVMAKLDLIHQLEHNTANIFKSFSTDQFNWILDALTEKATPSSIFVLLQYASEDVIKVIKNSPLASLIEEAPSTNQLDEEFFNVELDRESERIYGKSDSRPPPSDKLFLSAIRKRSIRSRVNFIRRLLHYLARSFNIDPLKTILFEYPDFVTPGTLELLINVQPQLNTASFITWFIDKSPDMYNVSSALADSVVEPTTLYVIKRFVERWKPFLKKINVDSLSNIPPVGIPILSKFLNESGNDE